MNQVRDEQKYIFFGKTEILANEITKNVEGKNT